MGSLLRAALAAPPLTPDGALCGYLVGPQDGTIAGVVHSDVMTSELPAGIKVTGIFYSATRETAEAKQQEILDGKSVESLKTNLPVVLAAYHNKDNADEFGVFKVDSTTGTSTEVALSDVNVYAANLANLRARHTVLLRLKGNEDSIVRNLSHEVEALTSEFEGENGKFLARATGKVYDIATQKPPTIKVAFNLKSVDTIALDYLKPCGDNDTSPVALSGHLTPGQSRLISFPLELDVSGVFLPETAMEDCLKSMKEALVRQLKRMAEEILLGVKNKKIVVPRALHFFVPTTSFAVTAIYPYPSTGATDNLNAATELHRRKLHDLFCLSADRPLFRANNAVQNHNLLEPTGGRLRNPHTTLTATGVQNGTVYAVDGDYDYYHYMQDGFDDNGWGCAYRSLQTICSWYRLQGYTDVKVPAHRDIQQICVDLDVMKPNFVGSKQWIGSMELGWVMQRLYQDEFEFEFRIESQVVGSDLPLKGRQLQQHFEQHGTPVMIGGNNLAHTILGINYNASLGSIKFLILDPHYTGKEDLRTIQTKGWCAWKEPKFFNPNTTYNLFFPKRPNMI